MSSGTRTHGSVEFLNTDIGPSGKAYYRSGTRVWAGANSPRQPFQKLNFSRKVIWFETVKGQKSDRGHGRNKIVRMKYVRKFRTLRSQPPKGQRFPEHPYDMTDRSRTEPLMSYRYPGDIWRTCTPEQVGWCQPGYDWDFDGNDQLAILSKLREKVAGSDFNAGVFLGEGHKALKMITESATKIYNGYRAARHGDFVGAARHLLSPTQFAAVRRKEVVASNWLQLQYGWLPLMKDAYDGAQFLAHHLHYPLQKVVRVHRRRPCRAYNNYLYATFDEAIAYAKVDIKAIIAEKDVAELAGLRDPLSIGWELLPYSFVVDWFIPIGNYLQARPLSSSLKGTFITSVKLYAGFKGVQGLNFEIDGGDRYRDETVHFYRYFDSILDVPLPNFKRLDKVASWKHCTNAVALLVNAFKR